MKEKITEVIVVEGKDDTRRLQEVVVADTIETRGSAIDEATIEQIKHAQETRGVIVFTDPDHSGEQIRKVIMLAVPEAKHAFLPRKLAQPKKSGGSLGVEHASDQAIVEALNKVVRVAHNQVIYQEIPRQLLISYGLIGHQQSKKLREKLGDELRIGYTNSKQLVKRLKMFQITEKELVSAMARINACPFE